MLLADDDVNVASPESSEEVETPVEEEPYDGVGPRPMSLLTLVLRLLGGIGGGLIGTVIIVMISLLGAGILQSALGNTADGGIHPLFVFVFLAMIFLSSTASNLLAPLFIGLGDRERYPRLATTLTQIFAANLVILITIAPVYVVVSSLNIQLLATVALIQIVVSAFASALMMEVLADYRYALLSVYSTALSVLISSGVYFLFYSFSADQPLFLFFTALPVMWICISLFGGLINLLYGAVYKLYGVDFLSTVTVYSRDENWESADDIAQQEAAEEAKANDSGANFLDDK
jgi:hypothetical protein